MLEVKKKRIKGRKREEKELIILAQKQQKERGYKNIYNGRK